MSNTIEKLSELGQSVWCDNLSRRMIDSGELQQLIDRGVVGVTSNPTIFLKAITGSRDYDAKLSDLLATEDDLATLYEKLILPDVADAADLLRPVYQSTGGADGYVSLEVSPRLAYDTDATIAEARRLFRELDRPNVLIKVPATIEGIPAIETLIGDGINVNVTLIFGLHAYEDVMKAYIDGLRRLHRASGDLTRVASVASFFVSRVDSLIDGQLDAKQAAGFEVEHLFGQAAIANAKLAYAHFTEVFDPAGRLFGSLADCGARVQRPLWASTSTKNPNYSDTMYVDGLIGAQTINTAPPATIEAVLDHGVAEATLEDDLDIARALFEELGEIGIDINAVTERLRVDGVEAFTRSYDELLNSLKQKQDQLRTVS